MEDSYVEMLYGCKELVSITRGYHQQLWFERHVIHAERCQFRHLRGFGLYHDSFGQYNYKNRNSLFSTNHHV